MRKNMKGFIAKLLVLCMIVGLLPVVALAAAEGSNKYTVEAGSISGGTVRIAYEVKNDANPNGGGLLTNGATYYVGADTEVTVTFKANDGYTITGGRFTYTIGSDTTPKEFTLNGDSATITPTGNLTINASFAATSTGGGTGGGGSSSSNDKVTVDEPETSGGITTVEVKVDSSTSGTTTTATVSQKDMDKAVNSAVKACEAAGTTPALVVKVETSDKTTAVNVNLPVKSLETLSEVEGATLSITSTSGVADIALDSDATAALAEQATGSTVTLAVKPATLNSAQAEAVKDATVIDVSVTSGSKRITSFGGGKLAISVKYTLSGGVTAADVQVYYLTDKGNLLCHETSYSGGSLTFTTDHLSKFVIGTKSMMAVFADVSVNEWYAEAVKYVSDSNLMRGVEDGKFAPGETISRAMVVTALYRMEGAPNVSAGESFTDVPADQWYTDAVAWASANSIVDGYGDGKFGPTDTMTREQLATIMYRYAKYKGHASDASADLSGYTDAGQISSWALDAMKWANGASLINGRSSTTLVPGGSSTRAELATMLMRYSETIV